MPGERDHLYGSQIAARAACFDAANAHPGTHFAEPERTDEVMKMLASLKGLAHFVVLEWLLAVAAEVAYGVHRQSKGDKSCASA